MGGRQWGGQSAGLAGRQKALCASIRLRGSNYEQVRVAVSGLIAAVRQLARRLTARHSHWPSMGGGPPCFPLDSLRISSPLARHAWTSTRRQQKASRRAASDILSGRGCWGLAGLPGSCGDAKSSD